MPTDTNMPRKMVEGSFLILGGQPNYVAAWLDDTFKQANPMITLEVERKVSGDTTRHYLRIRDARPKPSPPGTPAMRRTVVITDSRGVSVHRIVEFPPIKP